ncbi:hypothetical protein GCM10022237_40930 [Nocardioides ginsengisoli]|uniref:Uncharacterized protein n=1 Tax=Nocardioides ginsengisoli TaxID=363868 RepID=A0ABW3W6Q0_9ACTN
MLPPFEIVARRRPIALVGTPDAPLLAPYAAIDARLDGGRAELALTHPDGTRLAVALDDGRASLTVGDRVVRSRRHGRVKVAPERLGLTLTGSHLAVLTHETDRWVVRGRVDLREAGGPDTRAAGWAAGLTAAAEGDIADLRAGGFGQLGLRDIRLVSHADGTPYRVGGAVLFTATSAGPGFFDTAHTSVWALTRDDEIEHRADLWFGRPDAPGVYGDHATHLLRDDAHDRWLVTTSTWSDFPADKRERVAGRLRITLAESRDDLTSGQHLLPTRELPLPTPDGVPSVGVWDPHLAFDAATGAWLVGYVSARRFFDFHPVLASGPTLDDLTLRGAATERRATEGTTLVRLGDTWRVLASDGRDNRRAIRARFPIFDTSLREIGALAAPYPINIPWPTVVPPDPDVPGDEWRLVTFNGRPAGGALAGYGTHGDVVIMRSDS